MLDLLFGLLLVALLLRLAARFERQRPVPVPLPARRPAGSRR